MGCCCSVPRERPYDEPESYLALYTDVAAVEALEKAHLPAEALPIPADVAGRVAVFYVHPTLHFFDVRCNVWSEPSESMKRDLIRAQLGPYIGFGPIFAPFYREATIMGYSFSGSRSTQALELAYSDVERAFEHFLGAIPRDMPYFVVGHSQGSDHLVKLLSRQFPEEGPGSDGWAARRIVCAFLGGVLVGDDTFEGSSAVRLADGPHDVGAVATAWASVRGEMERPILASGLPRSNMNPFTHFTTHPRLANPISWEVGAGTLAEADAHVGALCGGRLRTGACGCAVRASACEATNICEEARGLPHMGNDYHICDFELWWQCIRSNAVDRARAALSSA